MVLVSTIQSLKVISLIQKEKEQVSESKEKSKFLNPKRVDAELVRQVNQHLMTLMFDEAHHVGAEGSLTYLRALIDELNGPKTRGFTFRSFFFGVTATPLHLSSDIQEVFSNAVF